MKKFILSMICLLFSFKAFCYEMTVKDLRIDIHINSDSSTVFLYTLKTDIDWNSIEFPLFFNFDAKRFNMAEEKFVENIYNVISFEKNGYPMDYSTKESDNYYSFISWQRKGKSSKENPTYDIRYALFNGIDIYNNLSTLRYNVMGTRFNSPVKQIKVSVTVADDLKIIGGNAFLNNDKDSFIGVSELNKDKLVIVYKKEIRSNDKFNIIVDYQKKSEEEVKDEDGKNSVKEKGGISNTPEVEATPVDTKESNVKAPLPIKEEKPVPSNIKTPEPVKKQNFKNLTLDGDVPSNRIDD